MSDRDPFEKLPGGSDLPRRQFLTACGTAAGAMLTGCAATPRPAAAPTSTSAAGGAPGPGAKNRIRAFRTLGRTGFSVSELGLGCNKISDPNLVRYAYDRGVNFFDTAERYGSGDSERMIGGTMSHMDRKKIFIVTKLKVKPNEGEQALIDRFGRCLTRMKTGHADALYMHGVDDARQVAHPGFHAAVKRLKAAGKVRHAGISSHGPRGQKGDAMEEVLLAAVKDGRFDLMLLVYNFMNSAPGARVLAACKEKSIGAAAMKAAPARIKLHAFVPDDPSEEHLFMLNHLVKRGLTWGEAVVSLKRRLISKREEMALNKGTIDTFISRHGITTEDTLRQKSVLWTLSNPGLSTVCVSMNDFETVDAFVPLAGARLTASDAGLLSDWRAAFSSEYCRHGCTRCASACPHGVPVSTVMRYAYYAEQRGAERHAMRKYAALPGAAALPRCIECAAPCAGACPHGLDLPAQLLAAHGRLTLI